MALILLALGSAGEITSPCSPDSSRQRWGEGHGLRDADPDSGRAEGIRQTQAKRRVDGQRPCQVDLFTGSSAIIPRGVSVSPVTR
ncbi:hypothetical protein GN956_G17092 [Arapaima gigas]